MTKKILINQYMAFFTDFKKYYLNNDFVNFSLKFLLPTIIVLLSSCSKGDEGEVNPDKDLETHNKLAYIDKSCSSCDFVVASSAWRFDGNEHNVQPGDTVGISAGVRDGLLIENLVGTEENPIVIINCDGRAVLGTNKDAGKGIEVKRSKHFQIAGIGSTNSQYGIAVKGYMAMEITIRSTNFEVFGVEVLAAGYAGIVARSDATCDGSISKSNFTQYNTILHHNYVHDTGGEGFYVGGSHWGYGQSDQPGCVGTLLYEPELKGVRVYNNIVRNTGRDGIQVGSAVEDCEIYNNVVENFGLINAQGHMTGFQINPGTTGKLYNNIINGGNGFGIFMTGCGDNLVYNNLIINPTIDGIMDGDRTPRAGQGFSYINNTIINPGGSGILSWSSETQGNVFYNNIITTPGNGEFMGGVLSNIDISHNILTNNPDTLSFVNYTNGDFHLQENSPAIDFGMDVAGYVIITDLDGNKRPNNRYDVGAYESNK